MAGISFLLDMGLNSRSETKGETREIGRSTLLRLPTQQYYVASRSTVQLIVDMAAKVTNDYFSYEFCGRLNL